MNYSNNSTDEILLRFKNSGQNFELITWASIKLIFALISQLMNASIIYITYKTKTLRQSYNILIVSNSICGFFFMFTFIIQFGIVISGINFISLKICYPLMILPIFFVQSQYLFYLALSIDRLITVMFPIWHLTNIQKSEKGNNLYLFLIFTLIICYAGFTVLTGIQPAYYDNPNKLVSCSTPDAVPSIIFQVVVYFNFISLICYLLLWAIMRKNGKSNLSANIYATRRILNSIISVFLLEFFGWFGNTLTRNILTWLHVSPIFLWRAMNIAGIILVPILALYAPVLYIMSKDYGRAFNNCFGFHFPFTSKHDNAGSSIINNKKGITIQQQIKVSKMDIIRPWTNLQTTQPSFVDTQRN